MALRRASWILAAVLILAPASLGAGQAAAAKDLANEVVYAPMHWVNFILSNVFYFTILLIFASAIVGILVKAYKRDRCLKDFEGSPVSIQLAGGREISGALDIETTGLALVHGLRPAVGTGLPSTSYLLYKNEFPTIIAIRRYHDTLDERARARRRKLLGRTYHPSWPRRVARRIRNFANSIKDALSEAFGVLLGQVRKTETGSKTYASSEKYIQKWGGEAIEEVAVSYDPLLDHLVGLKVVVTFKDDLGIGPIVGVLKDYTSLFLEIMDVEWTSRIKVSLGGEAQGFSAAAGDGRLVVKSSRDIAARVTKLELAGDAGSVPVEEDLAPGGSVEIPAPEGAEVAAAVVETARTADLVLPREVATVRNQAEDWPAGIKIWPWKKGEETEGREEQSR
jgi:hypothetical protein